MKQKTITTDKATLLVVELPQGAKNVRVETNQSVIPYGKEVNYEVPATKESYGYEETEGFALPEGNWQLLNRLPEVTEDQASPLVNKPHFMEIFSAMLGPFYTDYTNKGRSMMSEIHSFNTLLESEGVCFENPLGEREPVLGYFVSPSNSFEDNELGVEKYRDKLDKWHTAQEQVWDRNRIYIFKQVK